MKPSKARFLFTPLAAAALATGAAHAQGTAAPKGQDQQKIEAVAVPTALDVFMKDGGVVRPLGKVHGLDAWAVVKHAGDAMKMHVFYVAPDGAAFLGDMWDDKGTPLGAGLLAASTDPLVNSVRGNQTPVAMPAPHVAPAAVAPTGASPQAQGITMRTEATAATGITRIDPKIGLITSLQRAHYLSVGSDKAPAQVFMWSDPDCIHCTTSFKLLQPYIQSGKLRVFVALVNAVNKDESTYRSLAILSAPDPVKALMEAEAGGPGTAPMVLPPQAKLEANLAFRDNMDIFYNVFDGGGTPLFYFVDQKGTPIMINWSLANDAKAIEGMLKAGKLL